MEPIAIIGFSFKLPQGTTDESALWEMLESGRNVMTEWPDTRLTIDSLYDGGSRNQNTLYARGGHFVSQDPAAFDAPFFSITAREANSMDPQQRWALETSYHTFENAGIPVRELKGSQTGVFASSMSHDYSQNMFKDPDNAPRMASTGIGSSILANRLSWYYGLSGPSMHIDTACSGSLVALDLACQSLRAGDSSMALVLGTNLMITPETSMALANMNFISQDSRCWSFDHRANGYGRGEGALAVLLKPLSKAMADGDMIRAVVRASGTNQDGHTPGLTNPSVDAQERLIRSVYSKAGLGFESTRYVEAHGTGTPVGDPIEMEAIGRVFRTSRSKEEPLYVGSIKANIGHLEAGSGLAGVIKCILILEKGVIPRNALFERINPDIDLDYFRTMVPTENIPWPATGLRRVSVNSFGFGGTNAHVILDDASHYLRDPGLTNNHQSIAKLDSNGTVNPSLGPPITQGKTHSGPKFKTNGTSSTSAMKKDFGHHTVPPKLLVWGATNEKAINRMMSTYEKYYADHIYGDSGKLDQLAYTLASRRSRMDWRVFATVYSHHGSDQYEHLQFNKPIRSSSNVGLGFIFTGQGAQYANMSLELIQYAKFRETLERMDTVFRGLGCRWSIFDELRNEKTIHHPEYSQPLCTAVQIALVELLRCFGVTPVGVVGHSSGEIAAAYTIGALSLESACKVAYYRGQLAQRLKVTTSGAMLSVNFSQDEIPSYLGSLKEFIPRGTITIACINSPSNCTLSGEESAIDRLKEELDTDGIFAQKLNTGVAYHSKAMAEVANEYMELLGVLNDGSSSINAIPMVSSVTGKVIAKEALTASKYWVDNLISPVVFSEAVTNLIRQDSTTLEDRVKTITDLVEIGPHSALRRPVKDILNVIEGIDRKLPRYHSVLMKSKSAMRTSFDLLGRLFCHGHPVSLDAVNNPTHSNDNGPSSFLTDCPSYPFDHSLLYWSESRLSRDYRIRADVPAGSFLGRRFHDWNPLEPRWRNFISMENMPWLADHVIGGATLFPAAGMLAMAMEAVKQMSTQGRHVYGYVFKEANFLQPLVVGESAEDATETMLRLNSVKRTFEKSAAWSEITIFAYREGRWTECFQAKVQVQYEDSMSEVNASKAKQLEDQRVVNDYYHAMDTFTTEMDPLEFYKTCHKLDHRYGTAFQQLEAIHLNNANTAALARINVSSKSSYQASGPPHPTILDAVIQLAVAPISKTFKHTLVPHKLSNTWISADGWAHPTTSSLRLLSTTNYEDGWRHIECGGTVMADDETVLCTMDCLRMAFLTSNDSETGRGRTSHLLHSIEWKPQLGLMTPQQLQEFCGANDLISDNSTLVKSYSRLQGVLITAMGLALDELTEEEFNNVPLGLQKYVPAMKYHLEHTWDYRSMRTTLMTDINTLLRQCEEELPELSLYSVVSSKLPSLLRGKLDPVSLFYSSELTGELYKEVFRLVCDDRLQRFLALAAHEKPSLRIIEVGSGTGGLTRYILDYLGELEKKTGTSRFSQYVYTDVSPAFFDHSREKFQEFEDRMLFQTFDLNHDISDQGFEPESYDLVIAGSVIHATADIAFTLGNLRRLLKPGGRLINLEMVAKDSPALNIVFGTLPDWWVGKEKWRAHGPLLAECQWDEISRKTGFSGNDLVLRDFKDQSCHTASLIITTAVELQENARSHNSRFVIIVDQTSQLQVSMAQVLCKGGPSMVLTLNDVKTVDLLKDDIVVCLLEVGTSFLAALSEEDFEGMQSLVLRTDNLLWASVSYSEDENYPYHDVMLGFLRTLRSEAVERRIVTLNIETTRQLPLQTQADYINQVLTCSFDTTSSEVEFVVRNGYLTTARLTEEVAMEQDMWSLLRPHHRSEAWLPGPALKLSVMRPGELDSLQFTEDDSLHQMELGPDEIEIEAKAWALSFRDVFLALARLEGENFGFECTGIVTRVGDACRGGKIQPGHRVCLTALGSMCTFPRAPATSVFALPDDVSFEQGVSAIAPGVTAYYALIDQARLQRGEKILIHSGAGGTGQMAISIAMMIGAEVFATVGFDDKKQLLVDLGIPEHHIFYSRNTSFAKDIMHATDGVGVDVVLNSISGEGLQASWECVAPFGRFVEIGKTDVMENSSLPMSGFAKNVSFSTVDLHHMIKARPQLVNTTTEALLDLLAEGKIRYPGPLHVYPVSDVEGAFRYMQSGKNTGRIVINMDRSDVVSKFIRRPDDWKLDMNASYLVAGGLGGIGRSISSWMVNKGAKHLILPSRSGVKSKAAMEFVSKMKRLGISVITPKCDVSSTTSLSALLRDCAATLPPIKGCINATMVLQDAVFHNMSHAQWEATIASKVHSSWNLHTLLPDLDFFVLLSSLSGTLGSVAQSNYAAGCTFQDSLARFRASRGQKAVSLDIGWMRTIGVIAESQNYENYRRNVRDMIPLEEEEFLAVLNICCSPSHPPDKSQILIGMVTPAYFLAKGETPIETVQRPLFSTFARIPLAPNMQGGKMLVDAATLFKQATDPEMKAGVLVRELSAKLARALNMAADDVQPEKVLSDYGVDSLMAVELRNWIAKEFQAAVAVFDIMGNMTIEEIGRLVVERTKVEGIK